MWNNILDETLAKNKPGVYILHGVDVENPDQLVIYIGEGDPVLPRLKSHANKKDFWTEAIVFTSKDDYLTKTQIQYLESELITQAKEAYRALLDNTNTPTKPNISEVDKAEVDQFIDGIKANF
jgi:excinuclease UvrABC nuclease subunit